MKKQGKTIYVNLEAIEFEWEIARGKAIPAMGYNGQIPGPVLRACVGDTLVVRLRNYLPEPTTIHWHGLRVPAAMDGTEDVQRPVAPGETFEYHLPLTDAGTFWYHPHTNETEQIERGLYGAIVVDGPDEPVFDEDRVLILDDMKLTRRREFARPAWFLPRWLERHNGREGDTLLVNGEESPEFFMAAGQTERWRLVNVANARYFHLSLGGHPFRIIATDGGLIDHPVEATEVLLAPGERVELAVGPFEPGETLHLSTLPYDRGTGKSRRAHLATFEVGAARPSHAYIPGALRRIPALAGPGAAANHTVVLHGRRSWRDGVDFTINGHMHLHDRPVAAGSLQVWEIRNPSMMDHPFHLHGFFFQVLDIDGQAPPYRGWKDTVNVPRGAVVRIAWQPDERRGRWMYHCHILEHHAAGMMAHFEVV